MNLQPPDPEEDIREAGDIINDLMHDNESLRKQVAMLSKKYRECAYYLSEEGYPAYLEECDEILSDTQATAESYMAEHDAKVLEKMEKTELELMAEQTVAEAMTKRAESAEARIKELERLLSEARNVSEGIAKDAARYQYLRGEYASGILECCFVNYTAKNWQEAQSELDGTIDAAVLSLASPEYKERT